MSTTTLRAGDRTVTVQLAPDADGAAAVVDDVAVRVGSVAFGPAVAAARGVTTQEVSFELDGRVYRALVARGATRVQVAIDGHVHTFETGAEGGPGAAARAGSGAVVAPMPGKIVAVLVKAGDRVDAGQPLVVLEAMKMETTLAAEVAGTVAAVHGAPGGMVEGGALLVEVTPA
jgi:3-methylcrotonyl-CoA carboxylase alpha subunit